MLPEITKLEFSVDTIATSDTVHKSFDWDFDVGDFKITNGRLSEITGIEYVKLWVEKALRTSYGTLIYETYGSEHYSLIGSVFDNDYIQPEMERMIEETLLTNDAIISVTDFGFVTEDEKVSVSFSIDTIYGGTEVNFDGE